MSYLRITFVILLALIFITPISESARKNKKGKIKDKPALKITEPIIFNIIPKLTIGIVTGDAGKRLETAETNFSDKMFIGGGLSFERHFKDHYAVGIGFDFAYKYIRVLEVGGSTGYSYSIIGMYKFKKKTASTPYLRFETGLGHGKITDSDYDLGTNAIYKIGLGLLSRISLKNNTRIEIYYKHVSPSDEFDFSVPLYGIEFGFGFSV